MRTTAVILKSNAYGLILILDPGLPFEELKEAVAQKFEDAARFFRNAQMALTFRGRKLSQEEEIALITVIMNHSSIDIVCLVDEDEEHGAVYREAVIRALSERRRWVSSRPRKG